MKVLKSSSGKVAKLGRKIPTSKPKHLKFAQLLDANALPSVVVPKETHYSGAAAKALHQMYGNDVMGDCVIAGAFHVRGVTSANAKSPIALFSNAQVVHDYSAIGGYDPSQTKADGNNPTDNGCDENTALDYWKNTGFPDGVKLLGYAAVNAADVHEVRLAMYLFENLFFGVCLPDAWINPFPEKSGFRWGMAGAADPNNGHCFIGCDLVANGVKIDTWGMTGYMPHDAVAYYASEAQNGQLFTLLTPDIVNRVTQKSPAGYDINTLLGYLKTV